MEERDAIESKSIGSFPNAFSLFRFIPLLKERVNVVNPNTRIFLVQWITLLDSIPDLELVSYLPSFLRGLFHFLDDASQDVVTSTHHVLERFLNEIKQIARVKREIVSDSPFSTGTSREPSRPQSKHAEIPATASLGDASTGMDTEVQEEFKETEGDGNDNVSDTAVSNTPADDNNTLIPGQDVFVDHPKIIEVLISLLQNHSEYVQVTALRWIDAFFEISPNDLLPHVSELLNQVLPSLSSESGQVRKAAMRANASLVSYIEYITDEEELEKPNEIKHIPSNFPENREHHKRGTSDAGPSVKATTERSGTAPASKQSSRHPTPPQSEGGSDTSDQKPALDYDSAVNALTQQFLNNNEATRAASLSWLIMLQKKAPKKVLSAHDTTFPALLRTLADTSDTVVTRDLQLLCQISRHSDEEYFSFFIVNLLQQFASDKRLLETRGNLIIRQLCLNLSPDRIYKTMAGCLEKHEVGRSRPKVLSPC